MNAQNSTSSIAVVLILSVAFVGCQQRPSVEVATDLIPPTENPNQQVALAEPGQIPDEVKLSDSNSAEPTGNETDAWSKITELYSRAKESGQTSATSAAEWVADVYAETVSTSSDAANYKSRWVRERYEDAQQSGETTATNARDWLRDDIRKHGAWQYKLVTVPLDDPAKVEAELNRLGAQRWECYWVDTKENQTTFYLKRASRSFLRQLPAQELLRLFPLLGGADNASE